MVKILVGGDWAQKLAQKTHRQIVRDQLDRIEEDAIRNHTSRWLPRVRNAKVSGNAVVSGDARVYGNAQVFGDVRVTGFLGDQ